MKKLFMFLSLLSFIFGGLTFAHPGNTASDGCHYCRTNCDSWGVAWNQRHCHGGSTYVAPTYTTPTYTTPTYTQTCGVNSYSSNGSCVCYAGYTRKYPTISSNYDCVLKKTATQICQEQYGYNSTVGITSDMCACKVGYEWSAGGTYCTLKTIPTCGINSYSSNGKCSCKVGYIWEDPDDEDNLDCVIKQSATELCQETYGSYSIPSGTDKCGCIDGYAINASFRNLGCITATSSCQIDFGSHMYATGKADINGTYKCLCEKGYVFSKEDQTCEIATTENSCLDTINSYLATDGNCYCNDGYVRDYTKNMCATKESENITLTDNELLEAISWMYNGGLTSYNTIDKFLPEEYLTREQSSKFFTEFAIKILNKTITNTKTTTFSDSKYADKTLQPYIKNISQLGLIKGIKGKFLPFNKLTRAQAIAIIIRATDGIKNESNGVWYTEYYNLANQYLILDGLGFDFDTLDYINIKRSEMALLLYRLNNYLTTQAE